MDLKSPYTLGHSTAVAELAGEAGRRLGLPPEQALLLRRAGFVHGFGRLGVSNSIWDRSGPLSAGEWERVRMYPYLTERMLHQSAALAPLGAIAVQHRERLDGSGYPRGLAGLTAREVEVLILLARGMSNKRIAEHLVITPKTAGNHVEHIYAKIGASSRAGAALFAVQHGLLPRTRRRRAPG